MSARTVPHMGLSSLPLSARGVVSGVLGGDDGAYRVRPSGGGFGAANAAQGLRLRFGRSGVQVGAGSTRLGLSLIAVGYGSSLAALGGVTPRVRANRVVSARGGVSEWYSNGPLGLEQGFTVARAPVDGETGPLTLAMALSGDARASLAAGGQSVTFSHPGGASLRYGDLAVTDARGRVLRSWFALRGGRVLLSVDTRGARLPLRIDPLIGQERLMGTGEVGQGLMGYSIALSADGSTVLAGAPGDNKNVGAAWIFARSGNTWVQQGSKLTDSEEKGESDFGYRVALSAEGNTALVSGPGVVVFTRSGSTWTQQTTLSPKSGVVGGAVALSYDGNTALLSGTSETEHGAWIFTRSGSTWTQGPLLAPGGGSGHEAYSVALSSEGNTALLGVTEANKGVGAAWVFVDSEGKWTEQGKDLTGREETGSGAFGSGVALSADGNTALVGAELDNENMGAAWVYVRSGGEWTAQSPKLKPEGAVGNAFLGLSVALSANGNTALVGSYNDNHMSGAVWVYARPENGSEWSQRGSKVTYGFEDQAEFGTSVALSAGGEVAAVGAESEGLKKANEGAAWMLGWYPSEEPEEQYGPENEAERNLHRPCAGGPVNCATGNQFETQTDLAVGGRGPGLRLTRTYNSQLAAKQSEHPPFGFGWTGPYSAHLSVSKACVGAYCFSKAIVTQGNGSTVRFSRFNNEPWGAPQWVQAKFNEEGGSYVFTLPDQRKLDFDTAGQLMSETDRNGNALTMSYNPEDESDLTSVTDGDQRKLTFNYNEEGQVESVKDLLGDTVKYTYESGDLKSVTEPGESSARWQFEYDSSHQMTSETDGRSHALTSEYDSSNRVIAQTDPMERKRKWSYSKSESGSETTITEPNGSTTVEQFNAEQLPKSITHASGTALAATTTYEYNGALDQVAVTDPDKHTTTYTYDEGGDRTSATDANGNQTKWTYNGAHEMESITTPKGEKTTIKLDSHGNPLVIERPAPNSKTQKTTYKYDSNGDPTSETDPLGRERAYEYDAAGNRESETDPEGDKRTWKYNGDSQQIAMVSPRGNAKGAEPAKYTTTIERDAQGRPLTVTDPLGHTTKYTYDGDGNRETLTDGNGHKTTYTYDADNEPTKTEEPNGNSTETGYDSAGQITSQTDGNKHTTKYVRNLLEQVTEIVDPLARTTTKEYDAAGNVTKLLDPEKRTTTYTYDPANRLILLSYSDGKTPQVKYEYDKDGDRTAMSDGTGKSTYTFDQLDRLNHTTNGHGESVGFEYDLANEQTKLTYPNKNLVTRAYDKAGRLQTVTDWLGHQTKLTYDPDSNTTAITFPSGTSNQDKYAYNEADQMSEARMTKSTETLASLAYARDNDGQLKKTTSKGLPGEETLEYAYDENSRLTKGAGTTYEYDAANNPTTIGANTYTYDSADELEAGAGFKYAYNEVGQRAKATPSGSATTYGYNEAGNLTSIERPVEGKTPQIKDTYAYDGDGLRASQTISGIKTYMAWDTAEAGPPPLLSDGTNSYIYGPGNIPIEQINTSQGKVLYLHHDQQGSTRLLTGSTGATEGSMTYDAYGNTTATKGTSTTPLGYDGQYTSSDTGLSYMRAREYDPTTAQFLSVDPFEVVSGEPYSYAGDDPLAFGDPSGDGLVSFLESAAATVFCGFRSSEACANEQLVVTDTKVIYNDVDAILNPCRATEDREKSIADVLGAGTTIAGSIALPGVENTIPGEGKALLEKTLGGRNALRLLGGLNGGASSLIGSAVTERVTPAKTSRCECEKE